MTRRFRLASVLRARQAQENAAKGAVVRSRATARAAADERDQRARSLADRAGPDAGPANWYMAALAAGQALAAELSEAARLAEEEADVVRERMTDLTDAAVRRRTVETLADRHTAAVRKAEADAGQRVIDELAATRRLPALEGDR
jgi:flagellar FliJ protein